MKDNVIPFHRKPPPPGGVLLMASWIALMLLGFCLAIAAIAVGCEWLVNQISQIRAS